MKIQLLIIIAFIIVNNSFSTNGKSKQAVRIFLLNRIWMNLTI